MSETEPDEMPEWARALVPALARSRSRWNGALRARIRAVEAAHEGPEPFGERELLAALVKAEADSEE